MHRSSCSLRRLILGLSVEDAQSKFDTPESRNILRVAHERFNQGIFHELQVAQRQRNGLAPERKCHICRFTKPSVPGFQAYIKETPADYVIREVWEDAEDAAPIPASPQETAPDSLTVASSTASSSGLVSQKIVRERNSFKEARDIVVSTLASALELVLDNVVTELKERRQSGAMLSKDHQMSVVDRLVGEVAESNAKGYKSLSSSSHLLEPVEMAVTLFGRKDKAEMEAFRNPLLTVPAPEGDLSFSLWVAGGIIADRELSEEFPFHLAKFVSPEQPQSPKGNRLPHVEVEIYFSPELFQLEKLVGQAGIAALRQFVGKTMMQQHEPSPTSPSLLLGAANDDERELYKIYNPFSDKGMVRIPWIRKVTTKVSTITGVVFRAEDSDENPSLDRMRAAVTSVWRTWGHLVKDLHVHGDLDFLYVSISRQQEYQGNEEYITELKELEAAREADTAVIPLIETVTSARALAASAANFSADLEARSTARKRYVPLPSDFVVVECTLERNGLPHNMVMEDITKTLTDMQHEQMEMQRLSVLDAIDEDAVAGDKKIKGADNLVPLFYEPKVVVSHAGVVENGTHSFQRIRIRGSCLAHVEALAAALQDETGDYFTDRSLPVAAAVVPATPPSASGQGGGLAPLDNWALPKNLSFRAVRSPRDASSSRGLVGHTALSAAEVVDKAGTATASSQHARHQTLTLAADPSAVVTKEEREFWKENFYRLSDVKTIFHDRVDAEDALGKSLDALPPRVREHLALVNRRLSCTDGDGSGVENNDDDDGASAATAADRRKGKKGAKKRGKRAGKGNKKQQTAEALASSLPPEKMFEYLCTDMEAESTRYDLRIGDCVGYDYLLNLRRIPDKHLPLTTPAVHSVAAKGFINYYGPQRFATYTKMNMHPGLHLLKGEYRAAAHILVQQFYLDAALEAERLRTGQAFPRLQGLNGYGGARLPDFLRAGTRRSVAEHGTPMQRVLHNALQAAALLSNAGDGSSGDGGALSSGAAVAGDVSAAGSLSAVEDDPCAEAFMRVIGPRACAMLIQEFLCFVWNDVVNQRLQRYGTFSLLPGDLVRRGGACAALDGSFGGQQQQQHPSAPVYASRGEIERGVYTPYDLLLPLPGAHVQLPQNYTADLYVVTMQRYGLPFDSETRQWSCFTAPPAGAAGDDGPLGAGVGGGGGGLSPYYTLSSTFAVMEDELRTRTPTTDALSRYEGAQLSREKGDKDAATSAGFDASGLRPDLRSTVGSGGGGGGGSLLGHHIHATYRHPLVQPRGDKMQWRLIKGEVGDPYQRWGLLTQAQLHANEATAAALRLVGSTTRASSSSSSQSVLPPWSSLPAATPSLLTPGVVVGQASAATHPTGPATRSLARSPEAARAAAVFRSPRRWSGAPSLVRKHRPQHQKHGGSDSSSSSSGGSEPSAGSLTTSRASRRRAPVAPSWLPRHHGSVLQLHLRLPTGVYPGMLLREMLKMDVNTPDIVDLNRSLGGGGGASRADRRAASWQELTPDQQATYKKWIAKRRQQRRFLQQPRAIGLALLHQQIFRSSGVRRSLIPTLRSYDSVSK